MVHFDEDFKKVSSSRITFGDAVALMVGLIPAVVVGVVTKRMEYGTTLGVIGMVASLRAWRATRWGAPKPDEPGAARYTNKPLAVALLILFGLVGCAALMALIGAISLRDWPVLTGALAVGCFSAWVIRLALRMG